MTRTLPAIDARIEPMRTLAGHGAASPRRVPFQPIRGQNYFAAPLTFASFLVGASDYDLVADELYCPCGEVLTWDDLNLGTAVEIADWHIAEAHPEATKRARAKRLRDAAKLATECDVYPSLACTPKREQCQTACIRFGAGT